MITENLSTLKIHKLTQAQYDRELAAGNIDENALYLTPDEAADMSRYATVEQLDAKADASHAHNVATTSTSGFMSSADKTKLDSIATGANSTVVDDALNEASTNPVQNKVIKAALDEKADINHTHDGIGATYEVATQSADGLMSKEDKQKLDSVATGAEVNQNAFGKIVVGSTTIEADAKVDTFTIAAGPNITLTPDAANDAIAISATDTTYSAVVSNSSTPGLMTGADKAKLDGISAEATKVIVDSALSSTSTNAIQNKVVNSALAGKSDTGHTHDYIPTSQKGVASGVATLDSAGKVPTAQLPSYVDDVIEADSKSAFPTTGESGKIYVDKTTNKTYRWSGSAYVEISASLAIGTTSSTAAAGDHTHSVATTSSAGFMSASDKSKLDGVASGANNYTHPTYTKKDAGLYKITVDGTGHVSGATAVSKSDITALGIPSTNTTYSAATTSADGLMSSADKTKLDGVATGAQVNQNAFSNVKVGDTTIAADSTTDTLTIAAGSNITVTPDATNDKVTISATVPTKTSQLTNDSGFKTTDNNTTYSLSKSGSTITLTGSDGKTTSVTDSNTTYSTATTSEAGLMSAEDKTKLDGVSEGANKYTHPSYTAKSSGLYKVTVDSTGHVSGATAVTKSDITALGIPGQDTNTTYSAVVSGSSTPGLMTGTDKQKLDSVASGATKVIVDSALSSSSANAVQNQAVTNALDSKSALKPAYELNVGTPARYLKVCTLTPKVGNNDFNWVKFEVANNNTPFAEIIAYATIDQNGNITHKLEYTGSNLAYGKVYSNGVLAVWVKAVDYAKTCIYPKSQFSRSGRIEWNFEEADALPIDSLNTIEGTPMAWSGSIPEADSSKFLKRQHISSSDGLDSFHNATGVQFGVANFSGLSDKTGMVADNTLVLSLPYTDARYGAQILIDDDPNPNIKFRQRQAGVWGSYNTLLSSGNYTDYAAPASHTHNVATTSASGLMSSTDKSKLDGVASGAEVNQNAFSNVVVGSTTISADSKTDTLTLAGSNVTITPDATNDKVTIGITKDNVTNALGYTPPTTNTTYSAATQSSAGLMSADDKKKLDGVASGANNYTYTLPAATSSALGGVKVGSNITNSSGTISLTKDNVTSALGYTPPTTNTTYSVATTSANGLMSSTDKSKLDGIASNANNYSHPTTSGNKHIPSGGSSGQILRWSADGTAAWGADNNTTYSAATTSAAGLMSAADKTKLDGIATGANNYTYTHPSYTARTGKPTANATPGFGGTVTVSQITSDATGHVTGATDRTITIPSTVASTSAAGLMSASDKSKLDGIATGATKITVDSSLSDSSTNPVQNKVINSALAGKTDAVKWSCPTTIGAYSRICKLLNYGTGKLTLVFSQNSQAVVHTYMVGTAYGMAQLYQIGSSGYTVYANQTVRLVQGSSAVEFYVEVLNEYGYNGATTLNVECTYVPLTHNTTCTPYTVYTATTSSVTVKATIKSQHDGLVAPKFYGNLIGNADTATTAGGLSCGGAAGYTTDAAGNFIAGSSAQTWNIMDKNGTAKFVVNWATGDTNIKGGLTVAGTINGNATSATKATQDGSGNVITSTYATKSVATTSANGLMSSTDKSKLDGIASGANAYSLPAATSSTLGGVKVGSNISVSSGTISLTKANVTAALGYTPPTSDTNTTYSAGTGISLSGTTFSNSGVRSVSTGTFNGYIRVDTNGSVQEVPVKGLGSAAYTDSTAYAKASHSHSEYLTGSHTHTEYEPKWTKTTVNSSSSVTINVADHTDYRLKLTSGSGNVTINAPTTSDIEAFVRIDTSSISTALPNLSISCPIMSSNFNMSGGKAYSVIEISIKYGYAIVMAYGT